uniref:C-type lectin domain-containing protein n=1 Tax=Anolis carolinensis TaxID=28377 RepID=H9GD81_ANOCA
MLLLILVNPWFFFLSFFFLTSCFYAAKADTCAREWLQNQGNCYAYFDNKLTWQEAEIECQSYGRGAHLASVLTKAETLLVAEHISTYQQEPSNVWIGLHTRKWRWADESVFNYKAWESGQPDNYLNSEHCVELRLSTGKQMKTRLRKTSASSFHGLISYSSS